MSGQDGERNHQAKLTRADVLTIRREAGEGGRGVQRELARRFGVQESAVSRIVNRKRWKSAP